MLRSNLMAPFVKYAVWSALLGVTAILAACAGMPMQQGLVARDILEIKTKLDDSLEKQNAQNRKVDASLNSINENLNGRNDSMQTVLDDLTKQNREIMNELEKIRNLLQQPGIATNPPLNSNLAPGPAPLERPSTAVQAIANGQEQLKAGRSGEARESFRIALELIQLAPNPELKAQALYGLGESLFQINDLTNAYKSFDEIVKSPETRAHPKAWASVERMGDIQTKLGDKAKALIAYQAIVNTYPAYPDINRVKAKIIQLNTGAAPAQPAQPPAPQGQEFQ